MSTRVTALECQHLSFVHWAAQSADWNSRVLGAICFSAAPRTEAAGLKLDAPMVCVPMAVLGEAGPAETACEVWLSGAAVQTGQHQAIRYRHDGNALFGVIQLDESAPDDRQASPLQHTTERAYRQIFELLDALGYPFVFRFWNYMADINTHSHGLERYRQFNLGRQQAFIANLRDVAGNVPAACALGASNGPLTIAFLAGQTPPLAIENPRQLSAYDYPQDYGPRSPTFSRASLVRVGTDELLFVSGTASIVGHVTQHPNDVAAQTRETLVNIEAIINAANHEAHAAGLTLPDLFYQVYVRHSADLAAIRAVMQAHIKAPFQAVFLQADVCRQDLLVEIEASAAWSGA
jgi:enamine deaminase RidA (YjgF/YER057c/UK114 family)